MLEEWMIKSLGRGSIYKCFGGWFDPRVRFEVEVNG
jgi:hypothetical protein